MNLGNHPLRFRQQLLAALIFTVAASAFGEPVLTSWLTEPSGRYARLYESDEDVANLSAVTTWSRGQGSQAQPTYAGVHEISYTATDVYIRATGLPFHIMGPWYLNTARTNLFPNYPANRSVVYRLPRTPGTPPVTKQLTGLGAIGMFVDGVSMFDSRDAFSYNNANAADSTPNSGFTGDDVWNRDAYTNEAVTFDAANAHQAGSNHHYHANPPGLRHLSGDSVDYDESTNTYTENFNGKHSPILGWVSDGYPIYGPYGYSDPNDANSAVRRMITGYQPRNLPNGSARNSLPQWVNTLEGRSTTIAANQFGPNVSTQFVLGHYLEDYDYKGDLGLTSGVDFDLDLHNGRFCVTPEFPQGTFAYFVSIQADGTPTFPYNIGRAYFGDSTGGNAGSTPGSETIYFEGGPERVDRIKSVSADETSGDVVLTWSAAAGGRYTIETSTDGSSWSALPVQVQAGGVEEATLTDGGRADSENERYYRTQLASLAPFDDTGFVYDNSVVSTPRDVITVNLDTGGATPPPANLLALPTSITLNGQAVQLLTRPSQYAVQLDVDLSSLVDGTYTVAVTWPDSGTWTGTYQRVANPNVLLLIVDDWGIDASPIDNNTTLNPGTTFPTMATLQDLAANGVRFTNAYSQPVCSPTRAAILTGRQAFRTGVGNAGRSVARFGDGVARGIHGGEFTLQTGVLRQVASRR